MVYVRTLLGSGSTASLIIARYEVSIIRRINCADLFKITAKVLKAKLRPRYIDYDRITGLMASIFEEAYMLSPGHENTLADDYKRAGGSSRSHSSDTQSSN
jgi:hypothetical protein